ncbi:SLBB domain-containing protein, partial [Planctomycetota bacterium]
DANDTSESEELSSIELLLSGQAPNEVSLDLRQFGYDIFQNKVTTFAPVTNVPVGPDYRIGPGDRFTITIWGRHSEQLSVAVGRDGKIALPEVGVLSVGGMPFSELQDYMENELRRKFTDFKMHINMERLRTIKVYVVGEAVTPGSYTVNALGTALHALFAAGGPTKNGTLRNIQIIRSGQVIQHIDVYQLLMHGDTKSDMRLVDGDMLHIPLIGNVVGVAGNVRRPAIYETLEDTMLHEVLDMAGGITHAGWLQRVQIERIVGHLYRTVVDFDLSQGEMSDPLLDTIIHDGDVIKVFPVLEREEGIVFLDGHVTQVGKYQLMPGMRLADILNSERLFKPQVNLGYGQIERLVPPDLHTKVIPFDLGKLLAGDDAENLPLQSLDTIRLYRWDERRRRSVLISGWVYDPNEYPLVSGMRVHNLINAAGGMEKNAFMQEAEVTRRHVTQEGMTTEAITIDLARVLENDPEHNILLQDYDHLVVRPIPELDFNDVVTVSGEVMFPSEYPISRGERLSSLLARAGGYTTDAYLLGAVFTRVSAKAVQGERVKNMIQELEQTLLTETSKGVSGGADSETAAMQKAAMETKMQLLENLREVEVSGRVVIRLGTLEDFKGSQYDIELESGDELIIPRTPGIVSVVGEVFNQTSLLYRLDHTIEFYLSQVGGITKEADKKQISVIRADGSVISIAQKGRQRIVWDSRSHHWSSGSFMNVPLAPGDTIVVPRKLDRIFWLKNTRDITQIVFQMALAVGVVLAL